jgi:hypothetical protein
VTLAVVAALAAGIADHGWIDSRAAGADLHQLPARDTAYPAGWLYDRLVGRFGREQLFIIGYLPSNTAVFIVCTAISDPVTGPGRAGGPPITTRVWDKVRTERDGNDLGFVPDAFVKTGTTEPVADAC